LTLPVDDRLQIRFTTDEYEWLGVLASKLRAPRAAVVRAIIRDFRARSEKAGKILIDLGQVELDIA
jgi:hypothetical protein